MYTPTRKKKSYFPGNCDYVSVDLTLNVVSPRGEGGVFRILPGSLLKVTRFE